MSLEAVDPTELLADAQLLEGAHGTVAFPGDSRDERAHEALLRRVLEGWRGQDRRCLLWRGPEGAQGFALHRSSDWDTRQFGVPSGFIDALHAHPLEALPRMTRELAASLEREGQAFLARKAPLSRLAEVQALEAAGFYTVDTELLFELDFDEARALSAPKAPPGVEMRQDAQDSQVQAGAGMRIPFSHNRFSGDPRIGLERALELWEVILGNSLGSFADMRFTAHFEGRPVGVVTLFFRQVPGRALPVGSLFLVGCEPAWAGTGLMPALMGFVRERARPLCSRLVVETSAVNHRAQRFYMKSGFTRLVAARASMHRWPQDGNKH